MIHGRNCFSPNWYCTWVVAATKASHEFRGTYLQEVNWKIAYFSFWLTEHLQWVQPEINVKEYISRAICHAKVEEIFLSEPRTTFVLSLSSLLRTSINNIIEIWLSGWWRQLLKASWWSYSRECGNLQWWLKFGRNFEINYWSLIWGWNLIKIFWLKFGRDFEAEFLPRF